MNPFHELVISLLCFASGFLWGRDIPFPPPKPPEYDNLSFSEYAAKLSAREPDRRWRVVLARWVGGKQLEEYRGHELAYWRREMRRREETWRDMFHASRNKL